MAGTLPAGRPGRTAVFPRGGRAAGALPASPGARRAPARRRAAPGPGPRSPAACASMTISPPRPHTSMREAVPPQGRQDQGKGADRSGHGKARGPPPCPPSKSRRRPSPWERPATPPPWSRGLRKLAKRVKGISLSRWYIDYPLRPRLTTLRHRKLLKVMAIPEPVPAQVEGGFGQTGGRRRVVSSGHSLDGGDSDC